MSDVSTEPPASDQDDSLTPAARENIEALTEYQEEEDAAIPRMQGVIETVSEFVGSPAFFLGAIAFTVLWAGLNAWGTHAGWRHVDAPPFQWLQGILSFVALLVTVAVLIRQNRMSLLAARRAHLDLHVNLLTERKVSKVLEDLAALRTVLGHARPEDLATMHLATAADPKAILGAIKQSENDSAATS